MRDYLVIYVNGKECRIAGDDAFMPLSTFLRYHATATGTKVVCEEGDCGACSVILGKFEKGTISYTPVNSCIQFLYQLDCTHVVTIEGLKYEGKLNPVQTAMVDCHGAQCGYCTPGFVVTMCAMFDQKKEIGEQDIKDGLTGNLCRCTGYEPIIKAGLAVEPEKLIALHELYPSETMVNVFTQHQDVPVEIHTENHSLSVPVTVADAAKFKGANDKTVVVAGGTDVSVVWNKRSIEPRNLLSVSKLPGLRELALENDSIVAGARVTLSEIEEFVRERVPQLNRILWLFGSPQIRNAGTLAGNIANASPIADSLPFLHVMDAELELTGVNGTRRLNINSFYKGYKQLDLNVDELITKVIIPLPKAEEKLHLFKVSRRKHLDISAFTAAFLLTFDKGPVKTARIAYGGVGPIVLRMKKTEQFFIGKEITLDLLEQAGDIACDEITPISDVRGSRDFRLTLARNILLKLYFELEEQRSVACQL